MFVVAARTRIGGNITIVFLSGQVECALERIYNSHQCPCSVHKARKPWVGHKCATMAPYQNTSLKLFSSCSFCSLKEQYIYINLGIKKPVLLCHSQFCYQWYWPAHMDFPITEENAIGDFCGNVVVAEHILQRGQRWYIMMLLLLVVAGGGGSGSGGGGSTVL